MDEKFIVRWLESINTIPSNCEKDIKSIFENGILADKLIAHFTKKTCEKDLQRTALSNPETHVKNWFTIIYFHELEYQGPIEPFISYKYVYDFLIYVFDKYVYSLVEQNLDNINIFVQNLLSQAGINANVSILPQNVHQYVVGQPLLPVLVQQLFGTAEILKKCYKAPKNKEQMLQNLNVTLNVLLNQNITILLTAEEFVTDCAKDNNAKFLLFQLFIIMVSSQRLLKGSQTIEGIYATQKFIDDQKQIMSFNQNVLDEYSSLLIRYNLCIELCQLQIQDGWLEIIFGNNPLQSEKTNDMFDMIELLTMNQIPDRPNPVNIQHSEIDCIEVVGSKKIAITCKNMWFKDLFGVNQFEFLVPSTQDCEWLATQISQMCQRYQ